MSTRKSIKARINARIAASEASKLKWQAIVKDETTSIADTDKAHAETFYEIGVIYASEMALHDMAGD